MTLDQLQTFKTVAAARSFRTAAELLHLTQPAISKQIKALETELAEPLFERRKRAQLTPAGAALLKHVEHLSQILRTAKEEIADLREIRGGHLAIGAAHSMASYVLPKLIEIYRTRHSRVNLAVEAGWSLELIRRVGSYDLDLALIVAVTPKFEGLPKLSFVPLATTDLVFVISPDHPLARRKRMTWEDLHEVPWILNQDGCVYRSYVEQRLRERGQAMKVEVEVIGLELQKKLTQLGLGVALLPKNFVATELQQGRLRALKVGGEKLQTYSYVVFRTDRYFHGPMKAFLILLQESFAPARRPLDAVIANRCQPVD